MLPRDSCNRDGNETEMKILSLQKKKTNLEINLLSPAQLSNGHVGIESRSERKVLVFATLCSPYAHLREHLLNADCGLQRLCFRFLFCYMFLPCVSVLLSLPSCARLYALRGLWLLLESYLKNNECFSLVIKSRTYYRNFGTYKKREEN